MIQLYLCTSHNIDRNPHFETAAFQRAATGSNLETSKWSNNWTKRSEQSSDVEEVLLGNYWIQLHIAWLVIGMTRKGQESSFVELLSTGLGFKGEESGTMLLILTVYEMIQHAIKRWIKKSIRQSIKRASIYQASSQSHPP